jgi:hypothetical protein
MPVFTEFLTDPTEQDLLDLEKIYAELPADKQPDISALRAQGHTLLGARFNGRLLGAGFLELGDGEAKVHYLNVRKLTRQRGVARRFLEQLRQSPLPAKHISILFCKSDAATAKAMQQMGFSETQPGCWQAELAPKKALH